MSRSKTDYVTVTTVLNIETKVKLPMCFNWELRREGILGERRYNSTHSWSRH